MVTVESASEGTSNCRKMDVGIETEEDESVVPGPENEGLNHCGWTRLGARSVL